jgi:hypothetical protein
LRIETLVVYLIATDVVGEDKKVDTNRLGEVLRVCHRELVVLHARIDSKKKEK